MATKDQERKALEKIRKIIEELGQDSYIGTAFEGCFEIAEQNIENDFACSIKQQYEAEFKCRCKLQDELKEAKARAEKAERLYNTTQGTADSWRARYHEEHDCAVKNWNAFREQEDKVEELQQEIIRLKARLFDMMEAQGA